MGKGGNVTFLNIQATCRMIQNAYKKNKKIYRKKEERKRKIRYKENKHIDRVNCLAYITEFFKYLQFGTKITLMRYTRQNNIIFLL